ncbi:MAG: SAM-dependent methyltransferase [Deltaproteobacteria bacterium]|nr:SAM-dependent methyltransferase [Deltaproteobacteria bacterium]
MGMALYYPELGYYTKDTSKIGKAGDFYTSPHLHAIFGSMIGKQLTEMWEFMERPDSFRVVEMGAGMGYLAKDIMEYLKGPEAGGQGLGKEKTLFECLEYTIVELNPSFKTNQQALLQDFHDKVNWVADLKELGPVKGCFLSNELLDAFPVRMIEMDDGLMEIYVSSQDGGLVEMKIPCSKEVAVYLKEFGVELPNGYRTEVNLKIKDWLGEINGSLTEGFVLTIDYGYSVSDYYSEDRSSGTLLCYYQHQVNEDPYQNIGDQDLTAHVNFSSLKKWGEGLGFKTTGFCPQGTYLVSLGIDEVITRLYGDSPDTFEIAKIKGLILPQGMGLSHSVMVQYKGEGSPALRGFALRNQIGRL